MAIPAYICLGSNNAAPAAMLARAAGLIVALPDCKLSAKSSIYLTEPQVFKDQPWFHNQALKLLVNKRLNPVKLMFQLLAIETNLGRVRSGPRFGPRVIDIDILLFGEIQSDDPVCTLPHPRLCERAFALVPLREIAPEAKLHGKGLDYWLGRLTWRLENNKIFQ